MDSSCGHHTWADIVMVDSPEQLITVGIWEYQRIQGTEKWWLLRPSNLLWRRWGSVIWLLTSHYSVQWPGWIFPWSCVVHSILLHSRWSRMKDVQHVSEMKLNCFWHCYQSFRICLYVRIILMKLYCDAMKVSTLVPVGKKGFNLGFMCLASRLSRYNIPSNTNETTMANASQWFADQHQYSHHNWRQSCEKVYK